MTAAGGTVRVLLAPDKFKGTLTALEVCRHLAVGIAEVAPWASVDLVPVADGGDGTLAAAIAAGFDEVPVTAPGPTGLPLDTSFARRGAEAVVELAQVSGLVQLPERVPAPMTATSEGTGTLIAAALDAGCRRIVVGIGGSASTDGGAGLVAALGAVIRDADGNPVGPGPQGLARAAGLDLSGLHPALAETELIVACDVDNPLTGPCGAAAIYGPQKGATRELVAEQDAILSHWADLVAATTGVDHRDLAGAGAAGGVGFALVALCGAALRPGAELVFALTGFYPALAEADLVVTGEGSLDRQTLQGKAPAAVAAAARVRSLPVLAVAGRVALSEAEWRAAGIRAAYALLDEGTLTQAMTEPGPLLERIGRRIGSEHLTRPRSPA
ncbi:MAG: glycerate kinase [Micropruina sp.]